jgi:plasmid stabilization system protein ParE
MPSRALEIHPDAIAEAHAARLWYEARSSAAGHLFFDELDHAIEMVLLHPDRWPPYQHGTRRFLLRRFPFSVVYEIQPDRVLVVAVAHARRRPSYWQGRPKS